MQLFSIIPAFIFHNRSFNAFKARWLILRWANVLFGDLSLPMISCKRIEARTEGDTEYFQQFLRVPSELAALISQASKG